MTTQTHSPLPWKSERVSKLYGCYGHKITRDNGGVAERGVVLAHIATDSDEDRANAQLIVSAVNSHAALVGALESLETLYKLIDDNSGRPSVVKLFAGMKKAKHGIETARTALALAKGGGGQ